MPINLEKKLLFVHIPKTGGSTFEKQVKEQTKSGWKYWGEIEGLSSNSEVKKKIGHEMRNLDNTDGSNQRFLQHLSLEHYSKILSSNEWANLIKVSIVRNPWDRLVSFYEYNLQSHGRMGTKGKSFKDWFYKRSISPTLIPYISVNNQIPNNLRLIRFEKYSEDMDSFFTDIGLKFDRKVHEKKTKRLSYRSYYTSKMQRDLEKECEKDIEYFNFTF